MSERPALDIRELLRLLADQQAALSQVQRLVIEYVLAENRPGASAVVLSPPRATALTDPEPTPTIGPSPAPAGPAPAVGSGAASTDPESAAAPSTVSDGSIGSAETADKNIEAPAAAEAPVDQPAPADSPFGEAPSTQPEVATALNPTPMPIAVNPRASRYLAPRPVAAAKQVSNQELHRISRLCDVGDAAHLVLQFGEYRGLTLFQVAQADPDYLRSLALTAQRPQVRAAAIQLVRALEASERPAHRRRSTKSNSARRDR